jgi:hypothetical protein
LPDAVGAANVHTQFTMAFRNPRATQIVGVLQLTRCDKVAPMLTGALSRLENSWPISCVITSSAPAGDDEARPQVVELRIGVVFAEMFLEYLDTLDGEVVCAEGIRWNQHDDMTNRRQLIDVMFDPIITTRSDLPLG